MSYTQGWTVLASRLFQQVNQRNVSTPFSMYPSSKQFSFYSPVHRTYSRIDYFLLDRKLLSLMTQVEYDCIVISDHSPVLLKLRFPGNSITQRTWHLNSRLLADEDFVKFVETQIDFFLETNESPEISYSILWDTLKAFVRGQIISYQASANKRKLRRITEIMNEINTIDQSHSTSPSEELHKERLLLQAEFDSLTSKHAEDLYLLKITADSL